METLFPTKRSIAATAFFSLASPIIIAASFFVLFQNAPIIQKEENPVRIFASLPGTYPSVGMELKSADARVPMIRAYLQRFNSPLVPYAEKLVHEADKNEIDFRLVTAIARQESNLCRYAPEGTYNCLGWGIHKSGTLGFESFDQAIEVVSLGLKQNYINKGLLTPEEIMTKYTPHSDGSWARAVRQFMEELE